MPLQVKNGALLKTGTGDLANACCCINCVYRISGYADGFFDACSTCVDGTGPIWDGTFVVWSGYDYRADTSFTKNNGKKFSTGTGSSGAYLTWSPFTNDPPQAGWYMDVSCLGTFNSLKMIWRGRLLNGTGPPGSTPVGTYTRLASPNQGCSAGPSTLSVIAC